MSMREQAMLELEAAIDTFKRKGGTHGRGPFAIRRRMRGQFIESYVVDRRGHRVRAILPIQYSAMAV